MESCLLLTVSEKYRIEFKYGLIAMVLALDKLFNRVSAMYPRALPTNESH